MPPADSGVETTRLTGRQKQILDLLMLNKTSKEVALCLGIHSRTVDNHCVNIIRTLGVTDRYDAVRYWSRVSATGELDIRQFPDNHQM